MTNENPSCAADPVQAQLDRQLFHLKTLYDVSHELLGITDVSMILKNFLLMTMGNFGTAQGFIMAENTPTGEISHFESFGFEDKELSLIRSIGKEVLSNKPSGQFLNRLDLPALPVLLAFSIDEGASGVMAWGRKS